jgi:gamma-glutamylcyclotransferase (GGCT)/AIG2-like uncharacterized protein YtfP
MGVETYLPLFVYGSLREDGVSRVALGHVVLRRVEAVAYGRWEEGTFGFPAASFAETIERIPGELLWLRPERFAQAIAKLDEYEGVPTLFRRVRVRAHAGSEEVDAYAYEWARGE